MSESNGSVLNEAHYLYETGEEAVLLSRLDSPRRPRPPYCRGFEITLKHTTLGTTHPDE
jgi:hypothetical protein